MVTKNKQSEMMEPTDKCVCGHVVRDYTIRMKKKNDKFMGRHTVQSV